MDQEVNQKNTVENQLLKFKLGIDRSNEAIFMTDVEGKINYVNPAFLKLYGYTREEVIGQTPRIIKSGTLSQDTYKDFWAKLLAKEVVFKELTNKTKDGKTITIEASANPILDNNGDIIGFLAIQHDISEKKILEKMKEEFLSTVSHELRTPLTSMKNITTNILVGVTGEINPKQKRYLSMMSQDIDRLTRLINDLLDMSKIEDGKIVLTKNPIDIISLVLIIVEKLIPTASSKKINLKFISNIEKSVLCIDRDKIEQVVTNLIGNALKFTPNDGEVLVKIDENQSEIICSISDTGVGIPNNELEKVFDKFYQVGRVEGQGSKGTGLGLPIAKELIKLHGGRIWVESTVEKGSTFYFTLRKDDN